MRGAGAARAENGSGTVLAVGVIGALLLMVGSLVAVSAVLVVKQRVVGAADAAALAAADIASGLLPGVPCDGAWVAARANGASLSTCSVNGAVATVIATTSYLGLPITARSRAGPPGST